MATGTNDPGPGFEGYDPHQFPPRAVTVDIAVFTVHDGVLQVLMVQRTAEAEVYPGQLSLPGSFVGDDENLQQAAARILLEKADLDLSLHALEQFGAYGDPERDPRMRVISIGFIARVAEDMILLDELDQSTSGDNARGANRWRWYPVEALIDEPTKDARHRLAFDHADILRAARDHLRTGVEETDAALDLLPQLFTLKQLRETYEAIWGAPIDPGNFAKRVARLEGFIAERVEHHQEPGEPASERMALIHEQGESMQGISLVRSELEEPSRGRGRPPKWFSRGSTSVLHPPLRRPGSYHSKPPSDL